MKANLANREPEMVERWEKADLYQAIQEVTADRPLWILHDGPPYANGDLHMGHAVNKILKDIVIKSRLMAGYRSPYVPGWDCHGLPIEIQVEKKVGKVGRKIDAAEFRQKCREYADRQIDIQRDGFRRMGVIGDWFDPYATKDFPYEANMIRALCDIIEAGHLEQGAKPVNWCFDCGSALAEAEIEYRDKISPSIDVMFEATDSGALFEAFGLEETTSNAGIPIWTTTPWTLPANQAVALHADLSYELIHGTLRWKDVVLVVAEDLRESFVERIGLENVDVLGSRPGAALEGLELHHPFYERRVPVILGEHVTTEAGTGAVHTAPGHGEEDFQMGRQYDLPIVNPVGGDGVYVEDTELFAGEFVWAANDHIIEVLKERGMLLHVGEFEHSYPHCWRHKTPTAFRVTPQWFISMDQANLRADALKAIDQVKWIPDWGRERIYGMIENRPDWCISRQRTWGVPITLFVDASGALHPDTSDLMRRTAELVEESGVDVWYGDDLYERLGVDPAKYERVTDILDVWFDSGVSHYCVLDDRDELRRPAEMYLEGSDQHRGWFHSSLLTSVAIHGIAPYREVLTHGFVVDAEGRKMSKSLGNIIEPKSVMNTLGADVLRLWVAAADYRGEMSVSDEILKRVSDAYRRIRNTARFLLGNLDGFEPEHALAPPELLPLDRWAVDRAFQLQAEVEQAYDNYQFLAIYQKVHHFCAVDMGAFYLDIIKDRLYTTGRDSVARKSAQTAMFHILQAMVRWMAPVLSFTADEIWELIPGNGKEQNVLMATWYRGLFELEDADETRVRWNCIMAVREEVSREIEVLRKAGTLGSSLAAEVTIRADGQLLEDLQWLGDELRFVLITSEAKVEALQAASGDSDIISLEAGKISVSVSASSHEKCIRCWHYRADVGSNAQHPEICLRCVDNVEGPGETRTRA